MSTLTLLIYISEKWIFAAKLIIWSLWVRNHDTDVLKYKQIVQSNDWLEILDSMYIYGAGGESGCPSCRVHLCFQCEYTVFLIFMHYLEDDVEFLHHVKKRWFRNKSKTPFEARIRAAGMLMKKQNYNIITQRQYQWKLRSYHQNFIGVPEVVEYSASRSMPFYPHEFFLPSRT